MSQDDLLEQLGALAREQQAAPQDAVVAEPLDDLARARIARAVTDHARAQRGGQATSASRRRHRAVIAGALGALAAAAALLLLLRSGAAPGLPGYQLELIGGRAADRGAAPETAVPRFGIGDRIEVRLRPDAGARRPVRAQLFVLGDAGLVAEVTAAATIEQGEGGAVRITGVADELLPARAGRYRLVAVITARDQTPARWPVPPDLPQAGVTVERLAE